MATKRRERYFGTRKIIRHGQSSNSITVPSELHDKFGAGEEVEVSWDPKAETLKIQPADEGESI